MIVEGVAAMTSDETREMVIEIEAHDQEVFDEAIKAAQGLWAEAKARGEFPPPGDPMEGVDSDIQLAEVLNSCLTSSSRE